MGAKFASIHVRTEQLAEVQAALQACEAGQRHPLSDMQQALKTFSAEPLSEAAYQKLSAVCASESQSRVVAWQNGWISIYNGFYDLSSVKPLGLKLSKKLKYPLLTIGYFDDEVLDLTVIAAGKVVTEHAAGAEIEEHGLEPAQIAVVKLVDELKLETSIAELAAVFTEPKVWSLWAKLETALGIKARLSDTET